MWSMVTRVYVPRQVAFGRAECDALFREIDSNGDGMLSRREIKEGVEAIRASTGLRESAKKIWRAADEDDSNNVDADEFFRSICTQTYLENDLNFPQRSQLLPVRIDSFEKCHF